jgi:hypothetical protein
MKDRYFVVARLKFLYGFRLLRTIYVLSGFGGQAGLWNESYNKRQEE